MFAEAQQMVENSKSGQTRRWKMNMGCILAINTPVSAIDNQRRKEQLIPFQRVPLAGDSDILHSPPSKLITAYRDSKDLYLIAS